ncbi:hypothetical protein [Streptomyces odontomachi]|uniref:hypothetical protein n=1 Tax=Streptomyces odontomachi TaxID=2944940 RepID=UPI00210A2450|nr:hypothetical protein [Streptomyces sp. ODS25]
MTSPTRPAPAVTRQELIRRKRSCDVLLAAREASHSPSDRIAYTLGLELIRHPERCSTTDDYPGWTPGGTR